DRLGLEPSTDSAAPVKQSIGNNPVKSGRRRNHWRDNIAYWRETLAGLRETPHYRAWPVQADLFEIPVSPGHAPCDTRECPTSIADTPTQVRGHETAQSPVSVDSGASEGMSCDQLRL